MSKTKTIRTGEEKENGTISYRVAKQALKAKKKDPRCNSHRYMIDAIVERLIKDEGAE